MIILNLNREEYRKIWTHLIRSDTKLEQIGFLFCKTKVTDNSLFFELIEEKLLTSKEIKYQSEHYLELSQNTYREIVNSAMKLKASIVEIHSHTSGGNAEFSYSDKINLVETIDYMNWRMDNCSYLAIVATNKNFDALVWTNGEKLPKPLSGINVGGELITPTNITMELMKL